MTDPISLETFITTYALTPTEDALSHKLVSIIELLQKRLDHPYFPGKIPLNTSQNYELLHHLSQNIFKNESIQFDARTKSLRCTITAGRILIDQCRQVRVHLNSILSQVHTEKLRVWEVMEAQSFIDTRAIFQSCTADSKKAPIQEMLGQLHAIAPRSLPNIEQAIQHKINPTPVFVWARHDLEIIIKVQHQTLRYEFTPVHKFHHLTLSGELDTMTPTETPLKVLIVENLDTAFALTFMETSHDYDLILCASGQGNAGAAFLSLLMSLRAEPLQQWKKWVYFGDYDSNGFTIYQSMKKNLTTPLNEDLELLLFPPNVYKRYLLLFGKAFPKDETTLTKKTQFYKTAMERFPEQAPIRELFHLNYSFQRELEQNILIYCRHVPSNKMLLELPR